MNPNSSPKKNPYRSLVPFSRCAICDSSMIPTPTYPSMQNSKWCVKRSLSHFFHSPPLQWRPNRCMSCPKQRHPQTPKRNMIKYGD